MRPDSPKHLEDIRDAAAFVLEVTSRKSLTEYLEDRLLRQGVERNFEIIGEALLEEAGEPSVVPFPSASSWHTHGTLTADIGPLTSTAVDNAGRAAC